MDVDPSRGTDLRPHSHGSMPTLVLREEQDGEDEGTPQALEVPPGDLASGEPEQMGCT